MSTVNEQQPVRSRTWIYVTAIVVLVGLVVVGLATFSAAKESQAASDKADQLIAALAATGARTPQKDQVVRVLGDDGGATCQDPTSALAKGTLFSQMMNGAAGPGMRPLIADNRVVRGQLLIITIYCPDELARFQDFVDGLKLADTVRS
ncbi:hypothetical protein [Cellulomonas alba]|uniref:DUF732 domain-containing protein n=1 Tax=Cellulomonas alba TaxID=3053467 RepID=A0ABT7SJT1_9CELL|nr:hypothetical protein [Cellulomonas alba]MDM7856440.1 hypothetical protein [Cellulomonas alba]